MQKTISTSLFISFLIIAFPAFAADENILSVESAAAKQSVSDAQFPPQAERYILPCYNEAAVYWSDGTTNGIFKGSDLYKSCLRKQIELLTKDYFYGSTKKQTKFLEQVDRIAKDYASMYDSIYMQNKWCGGPEMPKARCGTFDASLSLGPVDKFYEGIIISISTVIKTKTS